MSAARADRVGPDPARVRFGPDFLARLEQLVARGRAARGREAGAGRSRTLGAGDEFLGYRPYRAGEELRHLDWALLARSERAFVRVFRREVGERWALLLDASASMGLGAPGKLQCAAEVATALAFSGLAAGARTHLLAAGPDGARALTLRRVADLGTWMRALEGLRAGGAQGLRGLLAASSLARAARVFVIGDLLDLEPAEAAGLARPGRRVDLVRVLAPHELRPLAAGEPGQGVRWVDPESGEGLDVRLDEPLAARYERALEARLAAWDRLAHRGRLGHTVWSSATPFEDAVHGVLWSGP